MAEEIREVLNLLNERLGGLFPYRLELAVPGDLKLLEKNARYMKAEKAQARADGYQAQVEIAQGRQEVQHEVEKVVEETRQKVEAGDAAGLSDSFNRLRDR